MNYTWKPTALPEKVLKNGEIMGLVPIDGKHVRFSNTSCYDTITEILGHAVQRCQRVRKYFEHNIDSEKAEQGVCYATTVLNHAKYGPTSDAYAFRENYLYRKFKGRSSRVACYSRVPLDILFRLLDDYSDADYDAVKPCFECSYNRWTLYLDMKEMRVGARIGYEMKKYMVSKGNLECHKCKRKYEKLMGVDVLPLVSIGTEQNHIPTTSMVCEESAEQIEWRASLDKLPVRFTIDDCVYELCGVIGRTYSGNHGSYHYVAYCRSADGRWDKRDSLNDEIESLNQLPKVHFSQIFYVNVGYWDAEEKKLLLEPAKSAWYQLTDIELPELCVEQIVSCLDNKQLKFFIRGAEKNKN